MSSETLCTEKLVALRNLHKHTIISFLVSKLQDISFDLSVEEIKRFVDCATFFNIPELKEAIKSFYCLFEFGLGENKSGVIVEKNAVKLISILQVKARFDDAKRKQKSSSSQEENLNRIGLEKIEIGKICEGF